jgi:hypothetical protein
LEVLTKDIPRVLREHVLDGVRARLRAAGPCILVVAGRDDAAALRSATSGDGAWLELARLDEVELPALGRELARLLKPGAPVACVARAGASWRRALEPLVSWRRSRGLDILLPAAPEWPCRHPLSLALLAAAEHVVSGWPLVRGLGRWVVHEGVRR